MGIQLSLIMIHLYCDGIVSCAHNKFTVNSLGIVLRHEYDI